MGKKAVLVTVYLTTRVIVDDNATDMEVLSKCKHEFISKVNEGLCDNLDTIEPDNECPFGTFPTDYE